MNQKNFDYLKDQVKYSGFGEGLEQQLSEHIKRQEPEFSLQHQATYGKDEISTTLYFKKSETTDMYFFNKYEVSLKDEKLPEPLRQTFYMNRVNNFTHKETYNLLKGRAVNKNLVSKDGQAYNAWVELNLAPADNGSFKQRKYSEGYGFELSKALAKLPLKELTDIRDKDRLVEGLKKGNIQPVTYITEDNKELKGFVKANPQFKNASLYDLQMQRVHQGQREGNQQSKSNAQQQSEKKEKELNSDEDDRTEKKSRKRKGVSLA